MRKIRICFIIRQLGIGGAQRQVCELIKGLNREKYDISLVTYYSDGFFYEAIKFCDNVEYICLNKKGRWDVLGFLRSLYKTLKRINPQIIYSFMEAANIVATIYKLFSRKTKVVWGIRSSYIDFTNYDRFSHFIFIVQRYLSRFSDRIIFNSDSGRRYYQTQRMVNKHIVVINNGIDIDFFKPDIEAGINFRSEHNINREMILVGLIARLDPMKNHTLFIEAAALLIKQKKNVCFICVGEGPETYLEKLKKLTDKLEVNNRFLWLENYQNIPALYNACDVVCSASLYGEGFSNVIAEAMACTTPCVVTNVGDAAHIVGETGVVVRSFEPQMMVQGLSALIESDLEKKGKLARDRIIEKFALSRFIDNTEKELNAVMMDGRGCP